MLVAENNALQAGKELMKRREFLSNVGAAALTAASYARVVGANDRLGMALVGSGRRGREADLARRMLEYAAGTVFARLRPGRELADLLFTDDQLGALVDEQAAWIGREVAIGKPSFVQLDAAMWNYSVRK